jgi:hypothetical protein
LKALLLSPKISFARSRLSSAALLAILASVLCSYHSAWGRLGENAASIETDRQQLSGQIQTYAGTGFNVSEITAPDGTTVREYVAPDGTVFAVAWRGSRAPNLSSLLGNYYGEYRDAAVQGPFALHHSSVKTAHIMVETGGPMRALWGRAIVPSLVPSGVNPDVIK